MRIFISTLIFFIFFSHSSFSKPKIYNENYFESLFAEEFNVASYQKCIQDLKDTKNKINNGTLKLSEKKLIILNMHNILCNFKFNNITDAEESLFFIIEKYNQGKISYGMDYYTMFKFFIIPIAHTFYPNFNLINLIDEKDVESLLDDDEWDSSIDDSDDPNVIAGNNTLLYFAFIILEQKGNTDGQKKLVEKFVISKKNGMALYSSILAFVCKARLEENRNIKIQYFKQTLNYLDEYLNTYDKNDQQLIWLKLRTTESIGYQYRKLDKHKESLVFLKNEINKIDHKNLNPSFLQPVIDIYFDLAKLESGWYKKDQIERNSNGFPYAKKAIKILLEELIYNTDYNIYTNKQLNELIDDNYSLLKFFVLETGYYHNDLYHDKESNLSLKEKRDLYWEDFDLGFKINQIMMSNEVERAVNFLETKAKSSNKKSQSLFKEKIKLENELISLNSLSTSENEDVVLDIENQDADLDIVSKLKKINKKLKETDNKIRKLNPKFENFIGSNISSVPEVIRLLKLNEIIIFINNIGTGYIITSIGRGTNSIDYVPNKIIEKDILEISKYIEGKSQLPATSLNNLYEEILRINIHENEANKKIDHVIVVANQNLSTFPYWLLITNNNKINGKKKINNYDWFSKKYSYSILPSIQNFVTLRNIKELFWILGVGLNETEIISITPNSNAEIHNFKIGDKIININDAIINNSKELSAALSSSSTNQELNIQLLRNNKIISKTLKAKTKKSANPLLLPDKIVKKIFGSKKYDFVGIGDPVLSPEANISKDYINMFFQDYQVRGIGNSSSIKQLPSLPQTREELLNIQSNFEKKKTLLFLGEEANEINIKKANLTNSKYIVFASHALTNGEIDEFNEPGIVLTPPKKGTIDNDGLLTASEIMNLDLNNTELVVLSACNTSAGKTDNSVALSGLAKSFFVAGAQSLIVSGWPVESESAAYLSSNTFKELMNNKNISYAKALQLTINKMIDKNMNPLLWSPFMLIGDGY